MTDGVGRTDGRTDTDSSAGAAPTQPDSGDLVRDWITVWQSELAAIAADREVRENWQAAVNVWAGLAGAIMRAPSPSKHASPAYDPAPRHASAGGAAPGPGRTAVGRDR